MSAQITIPDLNFKNALVNTLCTDSDNNGSYDADVDTNNDGEIQISEALLVTNLKVSNNNISNLTGIENFTLLNTLYCSWNNLDSLNFEQNINLTNLDFSKNDISYLFK